MSALDIRSPAVGFDGVPTCCGGLAAELRTAATAPRVIDFDPDGARRALAIQGFRARRLGRAGAHAWRSRARFRAEMRTAGLCASRSVATCSACAALDRCLERAGVPTRPRRPRPDDFDAPDLVLWLRSPDAMASVGFYRDSVRARGAGADGSKEHQACGRGVRTRRACDHRLVREACVGPTRPYARPVSTARSAAPRPSPRRAGSPRRPRSRRPPSAPSAACRRSPSSSTASA